MNKTKNSPDIFGNAIKAYFQQKKAEDIVVHSPNFEDDVIPVSYLFRTYAEMPLLEKIALDQCSGNTLDVGCGAGSHALYLQEERKVKVTAIDTSGGAIEICRDRGIKDARVISFYEFSEEKFDTILLLMNGTGIIGKMANLDHFFLKLKELLQPSGQVLIDSSDLSFLFDPDEDGGFWINPEEGYYGEMKYRLSYGNQTSEEFDWLYLDFNSLHLAAEQHNFDCELVRQGEHYDYLGKLSRK